MKQIFWVVIAWFTLGANAQAASFDCGKAGTKVEHIICANSEISKMDEILSRRYTELVQWPAKTQSAKQEQTNWLRQRNACHNQECVRRAYRVRLSSMNVDLQGSNQEYYFILTKGSGLPVCDAYLKRLNSTHFESAPFCDRPESDTVEGFPILKRKPMFPADVPDLHPSIRSFMSNGNFEPESESESLKKAFDEGESKVWSYSSPIDINNDGRLDNVQIWHGSVLLRAINSRQCGQWLYEFPGNEMLRKPQMAFVIADTNDRLDEFKTVNIFVRQSNFQNGKTNLSTNFQPIGTSVGIFKYNETYYFDTFFDTSGDAEAKRVNEPDISNTLGVFLNKGGQTKQVCEYLMLP
jgi:uncharacterized protein